MARTRTRARSRTREPSEIEGVMAGVQSNYGAHVMHVATQKPPFRHLPTGVFSLDMALFGGVPESLVTLIYGRESSGKTTLAMRLIGQAQKKFPDKRAVFIDNEGTYDNTWAARHGVDSDKLYLVQPQTGEQALDIADAVIRAQESSIIVVDSLAALVPFKELQDSTEDSHPGIHGRLIGTFCRKVQNALMDERKRDHRPTIILLNQWRMKIGVYRGDPRVLPGGLAQHYVASVKIEMLNKEHIGKDDRDVETVAYNEHAFKINKNKTGNGIKSGEFTMIRDPSHPLGSGFIDDAKAVVSWAKKMDLVTGGGNSWRVDGLDKKFPNLKSMCDYMYEDQDFFDELKDRMITMQREACGLIPGGWY